MSLAGQLHFVVGCLAVIAGFLALFTKKGSVIHKRSGTVYVFNMVMLCMSGFYMSFIRDLQFTFLLSAFSIYLVLTGGVAARKTNGEISVIDKVGFYYLTAFCVACFALSIMGLTLHWSFPETEPGYEAYAFIGGGATLFWLEDIKHLRKGKLKKDLRVKRHITRICSSMLIATIVFFLGNNHVLPEFFRQLPILLSPIVTVIVLILAYRLSYKKFVNIK